VTKFLVVFDVDSTLIEDEVIELLADVAGKRAEVAAITDRAMSGELDFASSLIERVRALEGLPESVFAQVQQRIRITKGAKELIEAVHAAGGKVGAVSGGFTQLLDPLALELNLDYKMANLLEIQDGRLTGRVTGKIIDRTENANALREWAIDGGFDLKDTVAVGDGANDLEMLELAGLGVGFNAKPIVRAKADLVI
jgi:phosphoserine phosphatase